MDRYEETEGGVVVPTQPVSRVPPIPESEDEYVFTCGYYSDLIQFMEVLGSSRATLLHVGPQGGPQRCGLLSRGWLVLYRHTEVIEMEVLT